MPRRRYPVKTRSRRSSWSPRRSARRSPRRSPKRSPKRRSLKRRTVRTFRGSRQISQTAIFGQGEVDTHRLSSNTINFVLDDDVDARTFDGSQPVRIDADFWQILSRNGQTLELQRIAKEDALVVAISNAAISRDDTNYDSGDELEHITPDGAPDVTPDVTNLRPTAKVSGDAVDRPNLPYVSHNPPPEAQRPEPRTLTKRPQKRARLVPDRDDSDSSD